MDSHTSVGNSIRPDARSRVCALQVRLSLALLALVLLALATSAGALASTRATTTSELLPPYEYLPYGPSPLEVANVYPSSTPGSPLVILVHGGGWRKQGPLGRLELQAHALQREELTVVEINYDQDSLLPAFPLEPNEVAAATRWAIANAASFNADPSNVVLLGGSAGGHLVALAAEQLDAARPGTVGAVISLSGPTDFVSLVPMLGPDTLYNEAFNKSVHIALGMASAFSSPFPTSYAETWSPALHAPKSACPNWLIFNSESEFMPLAQAKEMYANLIGAGCSATLEVLPGSEHAFAYFHRIKPEVFRFIKAQ